MKNKRLIAAAYLYLLLPVFLFLFGWLRLYYAMPLALLLAYGLYGALRTAVPYQLLEKAGRKKLLLVFSAVLFWVALSGLGGLAWQNRWDHMFRNALFQDLVAYAWPVKNMEWAQPRTLTYYIGFWLPGAVVGKLFGLQAGYLFQFIYGAAGVLLALFLLFERLGKVSFAATLFFFFFSGLDIIPYLQNAVLRGDTLATVLRNLALGRHMELSIHTFNSSSNSTLLFWLYNQIIPFWVGFLLLWRLKKNSALLFTFSLLLLFAPFPALAMVPVLIVRGFSIAGWKPERWGKSLGNVFRSLGTVGNGAGLLLIGVLGFYYLSNRAVNSTRLLPFSLENIGDFFLYLSIEFLVFFPFIWKRAKGDVYFWVLFFTMVLGSFVQLGNDYDFAWRTCIPFAFYLMLLLMKQIQEMDKRSLKGKLLILVLLMGAITPTMEMLRSGEQTARVFMGRSREKLLSGGLKSVFHENDCYDNFVGDGETFFFRFLGKE